jgi:hypothetical protein
LITAGGMTIRAGTLPGVFSPADRSARRVASTSGKIDVFV